LPSWNVSKIATILLVTDRPGSAELPAIGPPFSRSNTNTHKRVSARKARLISHLTWPAACIKDTRV
jgi:hypothetical protein